MKKGFWTELATFVQDFLQSYWLSTNASKFDRIADFSKNIPDNLEWCQRKMMYIGGVISSAYDRYMI